MFDSFINTVENGKPGDKVKIGENEYITLTTELINIVKHNKNSKDLYVKFFDTLHKLGNYTIQNCRRRHIESLKNMVKQISNNEPVTSPLGSFIESMLQTLYATCAFIKNYKGNDLKEKLMNPKTTLKVKEYKYKPMDLTAVAGDDIIKHLIKVRGNIEDFEDYYYVLLFLQYDFNNKYISEKEHDEYHSAIIWWYNTRKAFIEAMKKKN